MKKIALMAVSILMATTVMALDDEPEPIKSIKLTEAESELVENYNDFAFRFFRKAHGNDNSIMSPLSVTYALGMLNNGATGKTQQEINDVLGFGEAGAEDINQFCRKILTESGTLDNETKIGIANTIFVNSHWGYKLKEPFVEISNEYYDAQPETRDFYDGITRDIINQWGSDHTAGMIKEVLSKNEFDEDAASYLLNALYFKGLWVTKFNPENTKDEPFNGGKDVPMMHIPGGEQIGGEEFAYTENELYQQIVLPYGNGAYLMTVILPRQDKTIDDVLDQMDKRMWRLWRGRHTVVDLKLPRFETNSNIDLKPVMTTLGMTTAFDPDNADFSNFCNKSTFISRMKQVAKIKVDEQGTEAAAVTSMEAEPTSMPSFAKFHATRPFFYVISEQSTGIIFFVGQYVGDTDMVIDGIDNGNLKMENDGQWTDSHAAYDMQGRKINSQTRKKGIYIIACKKVVLS